MSFLEVVLGVALLGMVAGTLSLTTGAIGGAFQRQQVRLASAEIASRLLLIRADDEDALPSTNAEIRYGDRFFRWMIEERPVQVVLSEPAREASADRRGSTVDLSRRIVAVTVTTWPSENSGGAAGFNPELPHYTLTRLIDPIAFTTSDSAERRLETQEDIEDFMGNVVGSMSSGELPSGGGRNGGRSGGGADRQQGGRPTGTEPGQERQSSPRPQRDPGNGRGG